MSQDTTKFNSIDGGKTARWNENLTCSSQSNLNFQLPEQLEAISLIERAIGNFEVRYTALINRYSDIGYDLRRIEQNNERLLIRVETLLQQNKAEQKCDDNTIQLENRLLRFGNSLASIEKQIRLVIKLCAIAIFSFFLLVFSIAYASF